MKKKRASPGRPKKAVADTKSATVQIRIGAAEKAGFSAAANLSGLSLSSWMRERLRATARDELQRAGKQVPFLS
jgi:uncharacterized protein (DUF1778 family)